jgi:hypothetical protein
VKLRPSSETSPTPPRSTCHSQPPSHFPRDGSALKLHGQPKSQLQAISSVPASFHVGPAVVAV